jgi:hypothetical protein|tara:strand:- start:12818 stop:13147 length:330 start_codon:yes stop_codon:yes gene_type:complete
MADQQSDGWNEWSRHVLRELERLNENYETLRSQNEEIKSEMNRISSIKGEVDELKLWRSRVDDVVSPSQLQNALQEIESLKIFKSKAIAIFATVQFAMGAIIWALRVFA